MSDNTGIEWADATWNPIVGCDKVSPGCDNCYAIRTAHRMTANPNPKVSAAYAGTEADGEWTGKINLLDQRLDQPLRWRDPRRIFVNAQSDLFHKDVPDEFIARVWAIMGLAEQHTFQILTKRPGRMRSLLSSEAFRIRVLDKAYLMAVGEDPTVKVPRPVAGAYRDRVTVAVGLRDEPLVLNALEWPLPNVWLGTSVEDQHWADIRVPLLLDTPAAVRFLSAEPLLGPVDLEMSLSRHTLGLVLDDCLACTQPYDYHVSGGQVGDECPVPDTGVRPIDWVIVGGESGPGARPMHREWVRSLRDQCTAAGVAFLFKQWGEWVPDGYGVRADLATNGTRTDGRDYWYPSPAPDDARLTHAIMRHVGKRTAGRTLDGRTWDEYPS